MAKNILILNQTRMGDLVQCTPLIAGLRRKHPDARITLAVNKSFEEFARKIPHLDELVLFDITQYNDRDWGREVIWVTLAKYLKAWLDTLRAKQFDMVVNLSHSFLSAYMIKYLRIPEARGFCCNEEGNRKTEHPWFQYFFTEPMNRAYNTFNLVDIFGRGGDIEPVVHGLRVDHGAEDEEAVADLLKAQGLDKNELVIGIQAGSSIADRRWPASRFAELVDRLIENHNARIILFGVKSEMELAEQIYGSSRYPAKIANLCGKTSITQLIGMLKRCRYLVTNDTGTMHIAAALNVRIVGLFFAHAHPHETGPFSEGDIIFRANIPCAPCSYQVHCSNVVCIDKVQARHVEAMISGHIHTGRWEVPDFMKNLPEMDLLESGFDEEGYLAFKPLIRHPLNIETLFAQAYRRMWRDHLQEVREHPTLDSMKAITRFLEQHFIIDEGNFPLKAVQEKRKELENLIRLVSDGRMVSEKLMSVYRERGFDKPRIQALGERIAGIDNAIRKAGLTHPELNPLCDMFDRRKENFEGEDLLDLAGKTQECYRKFEMEARSLYEIIGFITEFLVGRRMEMGQAEVSSSRMAVPGR
ncbi:putative Heptosyltransferase family protein [Nitrospina gracilis 3/211]|uniref:Putative Heptosyltransferase family protein n=1 Tax=Nitrospina gracilis (strain 3/211) TaxID=1266370 RepID=M1Z0H5_NITG3|nr:MULTISPECIES: glycosyltransferase family 9 protein [Nitrospina]MCF8724336.1 lipopolysaccharide heptosyltransferase II [Nitrospina sp. Nb-3]CCQ91486.1 putative Heptosyltransferase family protein [Nitrospina gracilis 3/211]